MYTSLEVPDWIKFELIEEDFLMRLLLRDPPAFRQLVHVLLIDYEGLKSGRLILLFLPLRLRVLV